MTGNIEHEIWQQLEDYQTVFLATADDNQPKVRPVVLIHFDEKLWIMTGTNDAKMKQLNKNPKVELCLLLKKTESSGYIRFAGDVEIITDKNIKKQLAEHVSFFSDHFKGVDDPNYTLLRIRISGIEYMKPGEYSVQKVQF